MFHSFKRAEANVIWGIMAVVTRHEQEQLVALVRASLQTDFSIITDD